MTIGANTPSTISEFNPNLFPVFKTPWSVLSGGSDVIIQKENVFKFGEIDSYKLTYVSTNPMIFSFPDVTPDIFNDGLYVISYRFFKVDPNADIDFEVRVFVNGILLAQNTITQNLYFSSGFVDGKWNCYSQTLALTAGDEVVLSFETKSDTTGAILYFDGIKIEADKGYGFPTTYCLPNNYLSNETTGWASYGDDEFDSGTPFLIPLGNTAILSNNAFTINDTYLPRDSSSWYDALNLKITPVNIGDAYLINVTFKAKSTLANDYLETSIDVGGTVGTIASQSYPFLKGADIEQNFNFVFTVITDSTFITNGGLVKVTSFNGDLEIYDINYKITRIVKAL